MTKHGVNHSIKQGQEKADNNFQVPNIKLMALHILSHSIFTTTYQVGIIILMLKMEKLKN